MKKKLNVYDINQRSDVSLQDFDICIIGSGPAGLVLANELAGRGLRFCVLESGLEATSDFADSLRELLTPNMPIRIYSRERVIGGTSHTWHGLSAPLDPVEFQERSYLKVPGWPFVHGELVGYWKQASERYGFPDYELFSGLGWFRAMRSGGDLDPRWTRFHEKPFLSAAMAQKFGKDWLSVFADRDASLYYDATVVELVHEWDEQTGMDMVRAVRIRTSQGIEKRVKAKRFILAAGGIENARLLLVSRGADGVGLGNRHDVVGRYFMNHPKNDYGILKLKRTVREAPYYFGFLHRGTSGYCGLKLPASRQIDLGILNSYLRLEPLYPWSDNRGVEALITIVKHLKPFFNWWRNRRWNTLTSLRSYAETGDDTSMQNERKSWLDWIKLIGLVAVNIRGTLTYVHARLRSGYSPRITRIRIRYFMEMEPRAENRIALSDAMDPFGVPIPIVDYSVSAMEKRSVHELEKALHEEVRDLGLGKLDSCLSDEATWPINLEASHHMGATRIGSDPSTSVVDANLKVHGVENLYVAGCSVFPVSGCANPTYTICALSIRLAEHLTA